jgi:hypothetical protein
MFYFKEVLTLSCNSLAEQEKKKVL